MARCLRAWLCAGMAWLACSASWAAAYSFPGNLPLVCTGTGGVYGCTALTLGTSDTVTIAAGSDITVTGNLAVKSSQLNAAGNTGVTITVTGTLSATDGAVIKANVNAGSVSSSGAVTFGGSLATTTGAVSIDNGSTITGTLSTTTGAITLLSGTSTVYTTVGRINSGGTVTLNAYNRVTGDVTGYLVSGGSYIQIGGAVTSLTTYVSFGGHATVGGAIWAKTYVDTGSDSVVGGDITSSTSYIDTGYRTSVDGSLTAGGTYVDIHSDGTVTGDITAKSYVHIYDNNVVGGSVSAQTTTVFINDYNDIGGSVLAAGSISIDDHTVIHGSVTSTGSSVSVSLHSTVVGDVTASTTVHGGSDTQFNQCVRSTGSYTITLHSSTVTAGACCGAVGTCTKTCISASPKPPDCSTLHHLELRHASGTGLTCTPSTVTVVACGNAACSTLVTTGVSGTLSASGTGQTVNWPSGAGFVIPSGSSSATVSFQQTTAGVVTLGATAVAPTAGAATSCNFGSPLCSFTSADSGLLLGVPHHVSGTAQTLSITAVKKSTSTAECTPAFASVNKTVSLSCSHANPASGYRAVVVGGLALNALGLSLSACDGTARAYTLSFDAAGVATASLQYGDVGQVSVSASHTGSGTSAGLSMIGSTSFIAAPASFLVSGVTVGPIRAGNAFAATVTALNASNVATPNFGKESSPEGVRLSWAKYQPTGAGASAGSFTGTGVGAGASLTGFSLGLATVSDLMWSEVGTGDLTATLASGNYLSSGLTASGNTGSSGAVGVFIPHHFDLGVTQGCGAFTYSGQPFTLGLTARNASGGTTVNYNGGSTTAPALARVITLSAASNATLGSFTSGTGSLASTVFNAGVATVSNVAFTFTNKLTPPSTIVVRAVDADGVSSIPSQGGTEVSVPLRSGRLRLTNAFGSEKSALTMAAQAQHWAASKTWVLNSLDSCSLVPVASVVLGNYLGAQGGGASTWTTNVVPNAGGKALSITSGGATLTLAAPTATDGKAPVGTVDVGLNLGSTTSDASCLALPRPASTGANLSWMRAQFGSSNACLGALDYLRDPSARATFGVYAPEVKRVIHATEGP